MREAERKLPSFRAAHAGAKAPNGCLSFLPQGSSYFPAPPRPLKKKKTTIKALATQSSSTRRAAGWRGRPVLGSAQPRARALQRLRPNRSPEDLAVDRGDRARAHARGRPAPCAATSGALVEVRFRVAAPLAGGPWGLVTRTGVHERSRRRGSARSPESGRCAGGGRRCLEAPLSAGGLGLPPERPGWGCPKPKAGGGTGVLKGRGCGQRGFPAGESEA